MKTFNRRINYKALAAGLALSVCSGPALGASSVRLAPSVAGVSGLRLPAAPVLGPAPALAPALSLLERPVGLSPAPSAALSAGALAADLPVKDETIEQAREHGAGTFDAAQAAAPRADATAAPRAPRERPSLLARPSLGRPAARRAGAAVLAAAFLAEAASPALAITDGGVYSETGGAIMKLYLVALPALCFLGYWAANAIIGRRPRWLDWI